MTIIKYNILLNFSRILLLFLVTFGISSNAFSAVTIHKIVKKEVAINVYNQAPQVALVLGGGGARGGAHLGVLSVLEKAGVPVNLIVGTSIGSFIGALYADDPNAQMLDQLLLNTPEKELVHFSLLSAYTGALSHLPIENFVQKHIQAKRFKDLKIRFVAVASDIVTGQSVPLSYGEVAPAIAASMALPPFFSPVIIDNHVLVDGGITDPVPVDIAKLYHPKVIIAVSIAETVPPYRQTISAMAIKDRADLIHKAKFDESSAAGADVFIHPDVGQVGVFDDGHESSLMQAGITATTQVMPQICALLEKNHIPSRCKEFLKQ